MLSFWHILVVLLVVVLFFGNKFPRAMGDIGKGIRNLREELNRDETKDKPTQEVLPPEDKK